MVNKQGIVVAILWLGLSLTSFASNIEMENNVSLSPGIVRSTVTLNSEDKKDDDILRMSHSELHEFYKSIVKRVVKDWGEDKNAKRKMMFQSDWENLSTVEELKNALKQASEFIQEKGHVDTKRQELQQRFTAAVNNNLGGNKNPEVRRRWQEAWEEFLSVEARELLLALIEGTRIVEP